MTAVGDGAESVVVLADRLRAFLSRSISPGVEVAVEDGRVVASMKGHPFVSEGSSVAGALNDLLQTLREYAEDWEARLQNAPNHSDNWGLVQLVKLSSDEELLAWFERGNG